MPPLALAALAAIHYCVVVKLVGVWLWAQRFVAVSWASDEGEEQRVFLMNPGAGSF